jgi:hypothetical protein
VRAACARMLAAVLLSAALGACAGASSTGQELALFSKTSSGPYQFAPQGAWDLRYQWDCTRAREEGVPDASGFDVTIFNADDDTTAFEHPQASRSGGNGTGVLHYRRSGIYYLDVQTQCDWSVAVVDRS